MNTLNKKSITKNHPLWGTFFALLGLVPLGFSLQLYAQPSVRAEANTPNAWRYTGGIKYTGIDYKSSISRKDASETGLIFDADKAQQGGVGGGIARSTVNYNNGTPKLNQTNYNLSGRMYQRDNITGGRVIYRLDYLRADNNDPTRLTDDVKVWAPKLGLLTSKGNLFVDLEYARSSYQGGLRVKQLVPTVSFGMNNSYDWISLRPYLIRVSDSTRAMGKHATNGLDATWTHYIDKGTSPWMPSNFSLGAFLGSRIYAVNTDTGGISNLAHLNKNGINAGVNWKLMRDTNIGLYAGTAQYAEPGIGSNQSYRTTYGNVTLTTNF
ncbi:MAG: hypothetical protein ACKVQK_15690 [Burkholderiales bacterium]